jgi:hypothetical protein
MPGMFLSRNIDKVRGKRRARQRFPDNVRGLPEANKAMMRAPVFAPCDAVFVQVLTDRPYGFALGAPGVSIVDAVDDSDWDLPMPSLFLS